MARFRLIPRRLRLTPRTARLVLWLGAISLALGLFIKITVELIDSNGALPVDEAILLHVAGLRHGELNGAVVDLTALGSTVARPCGWSWPHSRRAHR